MLTEKTLTRHNGCQCSESWLAATAKNCWICTSDRGDNSIYRNVPKFSDARKLCCNLPKIQTKKPNLKDANGIANSEDPDQTAPQGAV